MAQPNNRNVIHSSELPPAQPSYVLRGHSAQIHSVRFLRGNTRLLTGDADGFVVLWGVAMKRAVAVWKAHGNSILGLGSWGDDKIITHGRDNKLSVWQLPESSETQFSKILPIDSNVSTTRKQPWLLHSLDVNALNFCSFTLISAERNGHNDLPSDGILIATPGVQDGHINIIALPTEERIATIPSPQNEKTGMVMAIALHFSQNNHVQELIVLAGYESGHTCVWQQEGSHRQWQLIYTSKPHTQPILSIGIAKAQGSFFTSSADATVARHPLSKFGPVAKTVSTKHAGQQALTVRSDEKIFGTAGWDGRMRVYSVKTMRELAVLKWHNEGCYALAFADVISGAKTESEVNQSATEEGARRELTVSQQRAETARTTHWLAAGSKDGKVSLWDIY